MKFSKVPVGSDFYFLKTDALRIVCGEKEKRHKLSDTTYKVMETQGGATLNYIVNAGRLLSEECSLYTSKILSGERL